MFGALVGSFLNVVIARLPAGESIVHPGSRCPRCKSPIRPWHNVPILSWVLLRGRCRSCKAPISARYPLVELLTAFLFWACAVRFGPTPAAGVAMLFAACMVVITFIDIDIWEIPDEISLPGVVVGGLVRPWVFDVPWWSGWVGAALGGLSLLFVRWGYQLARGREGMGLGDVKLIAMIGAFVGAGGLLPTILVASFSGTIIGVFVLAFGGSEAEEDGAEAAEPVPSGPAETTSAEGGPEASEDDEEDWEPPPNAVPFGPFLALGGLTQMLLGPAIQRLLLLWGA